ncbi:hypothetical protein DASB73_032650 [Starmerella bacillaris]|uniref:Uncharacterized protein n=1 Tax=Starmerella bacillaris TaxID=1247836 RepID=A0AAV5RME7_STABA|nr:hypothetical protein DASB73_032650 [Starmerella bacillaris]
MNFTTKLFNRKDRSEDLPVPPSESSITDGRLSDEFQDDLKNVDTADAQAMSLSDNNYPESIDSETARERSKALDKIYLKLDLRIIPALWVLYFLSSYSSAAYGNALTMNSDVGHSIPEKLKLTSNDISTATALDYVGFIIFDVPMNLCFYKLSPKVWMSRIIITVGLVATCLVAVKNAPGLKAQKFFGGLVSAGVWPGMAYYISMWYPDHRSTKRVGYYFTAAQISAAVAGLLGAAFQKMDGELGYTGYQWNFLVYGCVTMFIGILLYFWLPGRPTGKRVFPLSERDAQIHAEDMKERVNPDRTLSWEKFFGVLKDVRIWPLIMMYFGVVGCGIGLENYATTILTNINPKWSPITLSLLFAPIWLFDMGGILVVTPFADKFNQHRALIFCFSTSIIICGLFVTTFASYGWTRWGGLLICGFGLGATVPITMSWGASIFRRRHGDIGVAMATALISGLGNLGSVTTSYALYSGWPEDATRGYRDSNMVMVALLGLSMISAACCSILRYYLGDFGDVSFVDGTFLSWFKGRVTKKVY